MSLFILVFLAVYVATINVMVFFVGLRPNWDKVWSETKNFNPWMILFWITFALTPVLWFRS